MKVSLVFSDWQKVGKSIYNTDEGVNLSCGQFHSGTTFPAEIELDEEDAEELKVAMQNGYTPVWATFESPGSPTAEA